MHHKSKNAPNYGNGVVSLDLSQLDYIDPDEVLGRLNEVFRSPAYKPPRLPASATALVEMTRKTDVNLEEVRLLLEQDQMLAAEVLKIAQSSAYAGQGEPVRSLGEALVRLGLQKTSDIFLQAAMQLRVFRVKGYQHSMDSLRTHSVAVAHIARHVSRLTSLYDEHAFLCGLLHDTGIAAALIALSESTPRGKKPPTFSQIWEPVKRAHAEAGGILGRLWGLPGELCYVMEHHHDFIVGGYPHPTSAVIELSNALAEAVGCGFGDETPPESIVASLRAVGLPVGDFDKLVEKSRQIVATLS